MDIQSKLLYGLIATFIILNTASGEVVSSARSDRFLIDTVMVSNSYLTVNGSMLPVRLDYSSSLWNNVDEAGGAVRISANEETVFEATGEGSFLWTPTIAGIYSISLISSNGITWSKRFNVVAPTVMIEREGYNLCKLTASDGVSEIRYTTDGSTPTADSALYTGPFEVPPSTLSFVRAATFAVGCPQGEVKSAVFNPVASRVSSARAGCMMNTIADPKPIGHEATVLSYDTSWEGNVDSSAVLLVDGTVLAERMGAGDVEWVPTKEGLTTLKLQTLGASGNLQSEYTMRCYTVPRSVVLTDGTVPLNARYPGLCHWITNVVIDASVNHVCDSMFNGCCNVESVTIPQCVCSNKFSDAFRELYRKIKRVVIADGVTSVCDDFFEGCDSLEYVYVPSSVTSIGYGAFSDCKNVTRLIAPYFPPGLNKSQSISVTIPDGVTSIRDYAFYGCSGLASVTIPDGVTNIGRYAFYGCTSLVDVTLPDSLVSCDLEEVFRDAPFILSNTFPDFILSRSGKTLFGVKTYGREWDYNYDVHLDVVIPASVTALADFSLGEFRARHKYSYNGEEYYGTSTLGMNHVRIVFNGEKPEASELSFAQKWWQWDEESQTSTETNRIECSSVYYHDGASGWTWGEEWYGVKTYALNEAPDTYSVESNLKLGRVYGCEIPGADYVGLKSWGIWNNNDIGLYDDEYALIPVTGTGTIKPVILGDVPSGYLDTPQVWTDQKMFDTFTPKGVATSKWETYDGDPEKWRYETSKVEYEWPKNIWPDKKPVTDRRWIVIHAKGKEVWSGVWSFRVGLAGTSEISDPVIVVPSEECDQNGLLNLSLSDFFRGISISGYENFELWDDDVAVIVEGSHKYSGLSRMQTYELENWRANHLSGEAMTFKVMLPSAGTLVVSSAEDDDSPAIKSAYSVKGSNIVSDRETVTSEDWGTPTYRYNVTNFWKTSYASHIRRIEVSGKTTLTLTSTYGEDDCEFNRMYFFPKNAKSVAVEVGHIKWESADGEYNYWGRNYVQGYVTGCGVYKSGGTATLKAVSGEGEVFDHWEVRFGNLTLTDAQKTSPTLSFPVTDAMCGEMEDEEQIFISAIWKPKYKVTVLPSIVGAGTVTGTGRYHEGAVVTLTATAAEGCTFVKWSDGETAPTRQIEVVAADVERVLYACFDAPNGVLNPDAYRVFFDGNRGEVSEQMRMVEKGKSVGALPTDPVREKYKFLGWYTAKDGGMKISEETKVTADVTFYAHWKKSSTPAPMPTPEEVHELYEEIDGAAPLTVASEYNGYLYDEKSGAVKGAIQVKVGKPNAKTGLATIKATVVVGTKKVTLKGVEKGKSVLSSDGPTELALVGGESCEIVLGAEGISGYYGEYVIDGSRNFFTSKDKAEQRAVNDVLSKWLGSFMVVWDGGSLSVSIAAKGKVKVSGKLADGKTKVSASTMLLVGEEWSCVSVAAQKANLAFVLWLSHDGQTIEAEGLGDNVHVGLPGTLANGATFQIDADEFAAVFGQTMLPYLPDGVSVTQKGTKWTLPKAGKVVYKNGAPDESKLGDNPCGLKLTYKSKDGTFKGSFKVYAEVKGKPKATTVNVTGFMLNGIGHGTATIKKVGSVPILIE